jgi:signal transduction histidine kinase
MTRLLRPFTSGQTYRSLLYHLATLVLGSVGLCLLIVGWTFGIVFAITPLVVPILIGFRLGVGGLAAAGAGLSRRLLGTNVHPPLDSKADGFWARGFAVLRDGAFWRQQSYLLVSWLVALLVLCPLSIAIQLLAVPFYYHWTEGVDLFWNSDVDTLGEALQFVPAGLALLGISVYLLALSTKLSRGLAGRLLAGEAERIVRTPEEISALRLRALTITSLVATSIVVVLTLIWGLTTPDGYFWPIWPLLALSLVVGIPGWVIFVLERPDVARLTQGSRALAIQAGVSVILFGFLVAIWAITTGGYFWPIWPGLCLALLLAIHGAVVYARRQHRIERLEETRAGAVDVQESELRRIERDLHDGAQARLVALGMSLGRAEQALQTNPEAVGALLAEARQGAGEALEELRVLARGIRPPILTDRGLEPAIAALIARTPLPVSLSVDLDPARYESAVETAAYFTVAEALANAIKHGKAERIDIRIGSKDGLLVAEVVDDGDGGADPSGSGLVGLRQRAEALDGTLRVESPPGGPTTVTLRLPCG